MAHEPKLTVYTVKIRPAHTGIENTNRWLFRNIIGEANENTLDDSFIITELFRRFIADLDRPEMFSDDMSKKCMTANQPNIDDDDVSPNITFLSEQFIIKGRVEGGNYGRKRNKTSTVNKANKSGVDIADAITDDFYFLMYLPPYSNKSVLMVQSYTDDTIDAVMKKFWQNFFSFNVMYQKPVIRRFVPKAIIDDFKEDVTVSSFSFATEVPGDTLLAETRNVREQKFKITISITPTEDDLTVGEFEEAVEPLQRNFFGALNLSHFKKRKGRLRNRQTAKVSQFDLGTEFDVKPQILFSKFIDIKHDNSDFDRIDTYCMRLLEEIKPEIYPVNAIQER